MIRQTTHFLARSSCLLFLSFHALCMPTAQFHKPFKKLANTDMTTRIELISKALLNKPYELNALGEGPNAPFDDFARERLDAFDCLTFVETVLALAFSTNDQQFKQCLEKIRYQKGEISFLKRNHFTSIDWNANNQQEGYIKDITLSFKNDQGQSVALITQTLINKSGWYAKLNPNRIRQKGQSDEQKEKKLEQLKHAAEGLRVTRSHLPYLPLTALFQSSGEPNRVLFNQIPNGAIIEIVRAGWDLRKEIGTHLDVSHLGFGIWKHGVLYFRQSSALEKRTIDTPLIPYLKEALKSPTITGINIQVVVPKEPFKEGC